MLYCLFMADSLLPLTAADCLANPLCVSCRVALVPGTSTQDDDGLHRCDSCSAAHLSDCHHCGQPTGAENDDVTHRVWCATCQADGYGPNLRAQLLTGQAAMRRAIRRAM